MPSVGQLLVSRNGGRKLYLLLKPELDKRGMKTGRDVFFNLLLSTGCSSEGADARQ